MQLSRHVRIFLAIGVLLALLAIIRPGSAQDGPDLSFTDICPGHLAPEIKAANTDAWRPFYAQYINSAGDLVLVTLDDYMQIMERKVYEGDWCGPR